MKKQIYFIFILTIVLISTSFIINHIKFEETTVAKVTGNQIFGDLLQTNGGSKGPGVSCWYDTECNTCLTCQGTWPFKNCGSADEGLEDPGCDSSTPYCNYDPIQTPNPLCEECISDDSCLTMYPSGDKGACYQVPYQDLKSPYKSCAECRDRFNSYCQTEYWTSRHRTACSSDVSGPGNCNECKDSNDTYCLTSYPDGNGGSTRKACINIICNSCKNSDDSYCTYSSEEPACIEDTCNQCKDSNSSYCKSNRPVCIGSQCVGCTGDANCTRFSDKPYCMTMTGFCVKCTNDNHCSGSEPKCQTSLGECVECLTNDDCSGSTGLCNTATWKCVEP